MSKATVIRTIARTLGFILIGLMNTLWAKPEDIGTWKTWFGYCFLVLAAADIILLLIYWRKNMKTKIYSYETFKTISKGPFH